MERVEVAASPESWLLVCSHCGHAFRLSFLQGWDRYQGLRDARAARSAEREWEARRDAMRNYPYPWRCSYCERIASNMQCSTLEASADCWLHSHRSVAEWTLIDRSDEMVALIASELGIDG